ncbi:sterol desaturase family protein [Sphingobium indicum]|uniref:sterol desaturase family protein n=1 Tax=Sphingobium indicum TaxID=332055 RepID=UPI0035E78343
MANWFDSLERDLQSPLAVRRLGSGWFSGFFALLLSTTGLCLVMALRWPDWFATPELAALHAWGGLRPLVHALLIGGYALALLSLLLRTRKAIGATALIVALLATLLGRAEVQPRETHDWGVFFGVDFFAVNMVATGLMFAPIERLFPHRAQQRLFRQEWREDLFYYLISSMMVQLITFLALAPSSFINANTAGLAGVRAMIAGQPWLLQFLEVVLLTDFVQYWFHRAFHRFPFLWGFHAVHHSARSMDWLAGARMHFFEIIALRGVTSLPLLTFGFSPSVMQAYIGFVYIYSSLLHANLRGDFNHLGRIVATPRFHHWHHAIEDVAVDKNFAIHFPFLDRLFGTHHLPDGAWPTGYGVPEQVPQGYRAQFLYPFRRKRDAAL